MASVSESLGKFIDGVATVVSPKWGVARRAHRAAGELMEINTKKIVDNGYKKKLRRRGYKQAEPDSQRDGRYRTEDFSTNSLLEEQLQGLQNRAVGLYGENSIAHSVVESRVTYEVGAGLKLKPIVRKSRRISEQQAKDINDILSETIRCWSLHGVDKSRTLSMGMAQRLMVRTVANYGECFLLLGDAPYAGRGIHAGPVPTAIEFISPMRVETPFEELNNPNVRLGVKYQNKQIVGYYVRKNTPNDTKEPQDYEYTYYPRFDKAGNPRMVHIFEPMFPGQARGVPWITAAMNKILDFDDYQEAEIIAKQVEACFGVVYKVAQKERPGTSLYEYAQAAADEDASAVNDDDQRQETLAPGFINYIGDEDDITVVDPARPGNNYAPFLEGSLRMVASAANIPYEIIAKNFFRTTYSSGKLAMIDGRMGFDMRRSTLIDAGLIPIYRRVVSDRVFADEADGNIPVGDYILNPDAYTVHKYQVKQMGEIDEQKRVKAFAVAEASGIANKADYHDENGNDWETQEAQNQRERMKEVDDKLELEKYEMEKRKLMGLPEMSQSTSEPSENPNPQKKEPIAA